MGWKKEMKECFDLLFGDFAVTPETKERAYRLLGDLITKGTTITEVETFIIDYCFEKGWSQSDEIMDRVRSMYRPWLH